MKNAIALSAILIGTLVCSLAVADISGQDQLSKAREFYANADYDKALSVLQEVSDSHPVESVRRDIEVYRFECLIALDRKDEAAQIVEGLLASAPDFRVTDTDMPPKASSFFRETRMRILPRVAGQQYLSAKNALDEKRYAAASAQFTTVLELLEETDVLHKNSDGESVSLWMLAQEFRDLSAALAAKE